MCKVRSEQNSTALRPKPQLYPTQTRWVTWCYNDRAGLSALWVDLRHGLVGLWSTSMDAHKPILKKSTGKDLVCSTRVCCMQRGRSLKSHSPTLTRHCRRRVTCDYNDGALKLPMRLPVLYNWIHQFLLIVDFRSFENDQFIGLFVDMFVGLWADDLISMSNQGKCNGERVGCRL